ASKKSSGAARASASSTPSRWSLPARARRTGTGAPLPTQSRTRSTPAGGLPRSASIWSTAAARSGTESTSVPSRSNITSCGSAPSNRRIRAFISTLDLGQFSTHLVDDRLVVRGIEDGRAGHEGVGPGLGNLADVPGVDPAIHFQADITPTGVNQRSRLAQLVQGGGDELLPAEAGVYAHQQDHVDLVHHVPEHIQRGGRIGYRPGLGAAIADQLREPVDMVTGCRMEGDVAGAGLEKVADGAIPGPHHQMHVNWRCHPVLAQGTADHGAYGEVGYVV